MAGGALLLVGGTYKKLKSEDVEKIEAQVGKPVDELSEQELDAAIQELGIEEQPLSDSDKAVIAQEVAESE